MCEAFKKRQRDGRALLSGKPRQGGVYMLRSFVLGKSQQRIEMRRRLNRYTRCSGPTAAEKIHQPRPRD